MTGTRSIVLPPGFWERVRSAGHRLLMLDYDGTLAPFRIARREARPLPGIRPLLRAIASDRMTTLAVVSGRPLSELRRFLDPLPLLLVAEHGWEVRRPGEAVLRHPLPPPAARGLRRAAAAAAGAGWGDLLERKRAALVLHSRGLPRTLARRTERACARLWRDAAAGGGLRLGAVDGGIELRGGDRDKGTVVRELMEESPAGTLPVYLGDDLTDEDAFREVRGKGFGFRVGTARRPSRARGRILSPAAVRGFLREWLSVLHEEANQGVKHG